MASLIEAMAHERRSNLLCLVDVPVGLAKLDEVLHYASDLLWVIDAVRLEELLVVEQRLGLTSASQPVSRLDTKLD